MGQVEVPDGFGYVPGFLAVERPRLTLAHRTKAAVSRADVATQHERRGAVGPALENVRAARFLTDRMQVEAFDQLQHLILIRRIAQTNLQPWWLRLARLLDIIDYSKFAGHSFYLASDDTQDSNIITAKSARVPSGERMLNQANRC